MGLFPWNPLVIQMNAGRNKGACDLSLIHTNWQLLNGKQRVGFDCTNWPVDTPTEVIGQEVNMQSKCVLDVKVSFVEHNRGVRCISRRYSTAS